MPVPGAWPRLAWDNHRLRSQRKMSKRRPTWLCRLDAPIFALAFLASALVFWSESLLCGVTRFCNRNEHAHRYATSRSCSLGGNITAVVAALGIDVTETCACIPRYIRSESGDSAKKQLRPYLDENNTSRSLETVRIAAVVPFHNPDGSARNELLLIDCVESLRKQSMPLLTDVFVVVDGSASSHSVHDNDTNSLGDRLARALAAHYSDDPGRRKPATHVIQSTHHKGLPHARNMGVRAAKNTSAKTTLRPHDYILFLDADDVAHPGTVELLAQTAEATGADLAWGDIHFFGDQNLVWETQEFNPYDLMWANHPATMALVRSSVFARYGAYDENMTRGMEDWAFWSRIAAQGAKGVRVPFPLFHYRRHGATLGVTMLADREAVTRDVLRSNLHLYTPERLRNLKRAHRLLMSVIVTSKCAGAPGTGTPNQVIRSAEKTVQSLAMQSLEDFELVVITSPECGEDSTRARRRVQPWVAAIRQACANNACSFPVRVVDADSPAAWRNVGARSARGDLVAFLKPGDVILDPLALEKLALALTVPIDASIAAAYSRYDVLASPDERNPRGDMSWNASRLAFYENYIGSIYVVQKSVFAAIGGIDPACDRGWQDHDFWLRFIQHGYVGAYVNETLYRQGSSTAALSSYAHLSSSGTTQLMRARNPVLFGKGCDTGPLEHYRPLELPSGPGDASYRGHRYELSQAAMSFSSMRDRSQGKSRSDMLSDKAVAMLPRSHYRRPQHVFPYNVARHSPTSRPSLIYMVPHMALGGAEIIDINILQGLRRQVHVTLVVESGESAGLADRFAAVCDELFVLDVLPVPHRRLPELLDYIVVSRNAAVVFNRNSLCAYRSARRWRRKFPHLKQVDLLHLYETPNGGWERESAPYHESYDARFVISDNLRQHMTDTYRLPNADFTVIPNGLDYGAYDRAEFNVARPSGPPVVGFVGRLEPQKRPLMWVRMAAALKELVPGVQFVMVGTGSQGSAAKSLAAALGVEINYRTGPSPQVFRSLSVLVLTSAFEGVPLVMLEAAAAGVPTIAPDVGGIREVSATLLAQVFPANASATDIAELVAVLLDNRGTSDDERAQRRLLVRRFFGVARMQRAYEMQIKRLLDTRDDDRAREDYLYYLMDGPLFAV